MSRKVRLVIGVCILVAIGVAFLPTIGRMQVESALARRAPLSAQDWLETKDRFCSRSLDDELLALRISRKLGDIARFKEILKRVENEDSIRSKVRLEMVLFKAQGGRVSEVEAELPGLLVNSGDDGAEICEAFANGYIVNYQIVEASRILDAWEADYPDDPLVHVMRGRIAEHKGKWEDAAKLYGRSLECQPGFGPAGYNMARVLMNQKKPEEALNYLQTTADWLPEPTPALVGMAHCYRLLNRIDEARELLEGLAESSADSGAISEAYRLVGEAGEASRTGVFGELGQIELAAGNFDAASKWLGKAVEQNARDHTLHYLFARALTGAGREAEAEEHFVYYREAAAATERLDELMVEIRGDSNNPDVRCDIGEVFLNYISENQGIVWLNSVLAIDGNHQKTHQILADHYQGLADQSGDSAMKKLSEKHRRQLMSPVVKSTNE